MPSVGPLVTDAKYANSYAQDRLSLISLISRLIPYGSGDALDLGCGSGYISRIMSEHGWSITATIVSARTEG
jgi:2-polyprenyl-3-methyl-5-hydroxy-6-metoxy-1,4-benzoquinol methylase